MGKHIRLFDTRSQYDSFVDSTQYIQPNVSYCIQDASCHYNPIKEDYSKDYLTFTARESNASFAFVGAAVDNVTNEPMYSVDSGNTWQTLASGTHTVAIGIGETILFKGTMNPNPDEYLGIGTFTTSSQFDISGNIMSLLYGDNFDTQRSLSGFDMAFAALFAGTPVVNANKLSLCATTLSSDCYSSMFSNCTRLVRTPDLNATTLADSCYAGMFSGCTMLTHAQEVLPATTCASYCYTMMFYGCTHLTKAPELKATTLAESCYGSMFEQCTSLVKAPELNATAMSDMCYQSMFKGCTALTYAPQLNATSLAFACYQGMFRDCTALAHAPQLNATRVVLSCYADMFRDCTSLIEAPELNATTLADNCYNNMFYGCSKLNYIKAMFTTEPSSSYTWNWVYNVAPQGTFVMNASATWSVRGINGIPNEWTVQTA